MSEPLIDIKVFLDDKDRSAEVIIRKMVQEDGCVIAYGLNRIGEWIRWENIGRPSDDCRLPLYTFDPGNEV